MRIGINCCGMNDRMGGLRQYGQRLIRELLDNDPDNVYVVFHFPDNLAEVELIGGERLRKSLRQVNGFGELFLQLDELDVYFCPFAVLWPRPLPVPSVVNLSDIQEAYHPQFFTPEELEVRKRHYAPSTRGADCVLTVSEFSKQTLAEHHRIPPDKIFVAYHSAEASMFTPPSASLLRRFSLPERFIFYPANHWQHKNHDVLLRALVHLREAGTVIPCVLTGQEQDNGYPLREKIAGYGLDDQVHVLGYVTNEEIRALFHEAAMLCFPSLFEGFGMPLVDAMAAGCPIACADAASIPEVVGKAALLFDPSAHEDVAEKILTLWNDARLGGELVAAGRERVKIFTAANMAKVHLQAFNAAIEAFDPEGREFYRHEVWGPLKQLPQTADRARALEAALHDRDAIAGALQKRLEQLESSLSWRLTAPLRKILDVLRR